MRGRYRPDRGTHTGGRGTRTYNRFVRNGIAHGGVTYTSNKVEYKTRNNVVVLSPTEMVQLADDLLDVCNGLALAFKVFLLASGAPASELPRELWFQELQAAVRAPFWEIEACLIATIAQGTQLNVYVSADTGSYENARFFALHTAVVAEQLAPGFGRYFLSLRAVGGLQGWAVFDGAELHRLRLAGASSLLFRQT